MYHSVIKNLTCFLLFNVSRIILCLRSMFIRWGSQCWTNVLFLRMSKYVRFSRKRLERRQTKYAPLSLIYLSYVRYKHTLKRFIICRYLLSLTLFLLQVLPLLKFMLLAPMVGKKSLSRSSMELSYLYMMPSNKSLVFLYSLYLLFWICFSAGSACAYDRHCSSRYCSCWSYGEHLAPDLPIIWLQVQSLSHLL